MLRRYSEPNSFGGTRWEIELHTLLRIVLNETDSGTFVAELKERKWVRDKVHFKFTSDKHPVLVAVDAIVRSRTMVEGHPQYSWPAIMARIQEIPLVDRLRAEFGDERMADADEGYRAGNRQVDRSKSSEEIGGALFELAQRSVNLYTKSSLHSFFQTDKAKSEFELLILNVVTIEELLSEQGIDGRRRKRVEEALHNKLVNEFVDQGYMKMTLMRDDNPKFLAQRIELCRKGIDYMRDPFAIPTHLVAHIFFAPLEASGELNTIIEEDKKRAAFTTYVAFPFAYRSFLPVISNEMKAITSSLRY